MITTRAPDGANKKDDILLPVVQNTLVEKPHQQLRPFLHMLKSQLGQKPPGKTLIVCFRTGFSMSKFTMSIFIMLRFTMAMFTMSRFTKITMSRFTMCQGLSCQGLPSVKATTFYNEKWFSSVQLDVDSL